MAGPFISKENESTVLAAIKAKLALKADATHTHAAADITDFTSSVNSVLAEQNIRACTSEEVQALLSELDA